MMVNDIEFSIKEKNGILRRTNRKEFLDTEKSVLNKKLSNFSILFVCCNSYGAILKCLDYLKTESNKNFDIIIVDNSTKEEESQSFYKLGKENKNISILKPIDNLGGSGGFSIGMEFIINEGYDYMLIFEDDIIPIEKDIVTTFIEKTDIKNLIFNECSNEGNSFWCFHLACYPIEFIKKSGVVDPRFFIKSDDLEWIERVERVVRDDNYKKISTGKHHYHPNFKKDGWKIWVTYLAIRNYLVTFTKYFRFNNYSYFFTLFLYIRYGVSKLFFERTIKLLKYEFCAIKDYLFGNVGYQYNKKILNILFKQSLSKPKECEDKRISLEELNKISHLMFNLYGKITGSYNSFSSIEFSKSIKDIKNGVIVNGIYSNIYPIFMNFSKILAINEIDFIKKRVNVYKYENQYKFKLLRTLLSIIISIILYVPILVAIFIKILISVISNKLNSN